MKTALKILLLLPFFYLEAHSFPANCSSASQLANSLGITTYVCVDSTNNFGFYYNPPAANMNVVIRRSDGKLFCQRQTSQTIKKYGILNQHSRIGTHFTTDEPNTMLFTDKFLNNISNPSIQTVGSIWTFWQKTGDEKKFIQTYSPSSRITDNCGEYTNGCNTPFRELIDNTVYLIHGLDCSPNRIKIWNSRIVELNQKINEILAQYGKIDPEHPLIKEEKKIINTAKFCCHIIELP
jgi:hypothetical protein